MNNTDYFNNVKLGTGAEGFKKTIRRNPSNSSDFSSDNHKKANNKSASRNKRKECT